MTLDGACRPPLAGAGAGPDRIVLRQVAAKTIRSLLDRIAKALASPAPATEPAPWHAGERQPRLAGDPETA